MEGVFMGQITGSVSSGAYDETKSAQIFFSGMESNACSKLSHYNKTYSLVLSDDVIKTNDELLKLRDEVKRLTDECNDWKTRYAKANNELFQKGLAYGTLETTYKNEKIAGELLLKDRDMWKRRWNSVVTDIGESLKANGIAFVLKEIHGDGNWDVVIDIPELNEAKKKVEDLEKKLKAAKSNETFWRDRKEEEEDYHHYWLHTFDRAVKQAADKGIHIGVCGSDEEDNVGIVTVYNMKAEELETQVVALEKTNKNLDQKIGAADNALEYWNNTYNDIVIAGKKVGVKIDIKGKKPDSNAGFVYVTNEKASELEKQIVETFADLEKRLAATKSKETFWRNTYYEIVEKVQDFGVSVDYVGCDSDNNCALLHIRNRNNQKWQAMTEALKAKGVEVIYMGEQDGKPIVDVKIPGWEMDKQWVTTFSKRVAELRADKFGLEAERDELKEKCDILRKDGALKGQQCLKLTADPNALKKEYGRVISEIAELKSETVAEVRYEFRPNCLTIIYTKCDGSKQTISMDSSEAIDANSISCGTVPKCSSCSHFMHNPSRFAHDWCYMPIPKEGGAGYIRKLNKEESEGPACSDFKARKE